MVLPARCAQVAVLTLFLGSARLFAQSSTDSIGWHFVGALGYVQTSGNTDLSTLNLTERLAWRSSRPWLFSEAAAWVYGKTGGTESADQILGSLRADYTVHANLSAYGLVTYERNTFAGVEHRYAELLGLSWTGSPGPKSVLGVDIGAGNNQQITGGTSTTYWLARLASRYRYNFTDKAYAEEALEFLEDLKDTGDLRTTSTTSLVAPLTASIGIRLGLLLKHTAEPPTDPSTGLPFKKLDTTFQSGIQITL